MLCIFHASRFIAYNIRIRLCASFHSTKADFYIKDYEYNWLQSKLNDGGILVSFYDCDLTGVHGARRLRKEYGIIPIIIPRSYGAKDFSELITMYSKETINLFIEQTESLFEYD